MPQQLINEIEEEVKDDQGQAHIDEAYQSLSEEDKASFLNEGKHMCKWGDNYDEALLLIDTHSAELNSMLANSIQEIYPLRRMMTETENSIAGTQL
jgi:hypothetical protein